MKKAMKIVYYFGKKNSILDVSQGSEYVRLWWS